MSAISFLGSFPFCIKETAQDGLPVEIWDGTTYYDSLGPSEDGAYVGPEEEVLRWVPAKNAGVSSYDENGDFTGDLRVDVVGEGTERPVGLTLEELTFMYWRVRRWDVKPINGDAWSYEIGEVSVDIWPQIENGLEFENTLRTPGSPPQFSRPKPDAEKGLVCPFSYYLSYGQSLGAAEDGVDLSTPPSYAYESVSVRHNISIRLLPIIVSDYLIESPIYRIGDLYYPPIRVRSVAGGNFGLVPSGYLRVKGRLEYDDLEGGGSGVIGYYREIGNYFEMSIWPYKPKEETYNFDLWEGDESAWPWYGYGPPLPLPTGLQRALKENAFRLILKFPSRDITIPYYAIYNPNDAFRNDNVGTEYEVLYDYSVEDLEGPITYTIEASKYYTYGGTYDEDTGEPV
jgi:hypothetical protein